MPPELLYKPDFPLSVFAGDRHRMTHEKQKQQLEIEQQHQSQNKYHYQVDFSSALRIARKYFWRDSRTEKDIIHLMIKYVHAVKEELRQFSRPLRGIGAVHFAFR